MNYYSVQLPNGETATLYTSNPIDGKIAVTVTKPTIDDFVGSEVVVHDGANAVNGTLRLVRGRTRNSYLVAGGRFRVWFHAEDVVKVGHSTSTVIEVRDAGR